MRLVAKAFAVNLVDVLGAGRPRGEPAALRADLDAADRRVVVRARDRALVRCARRRVRCRGSASGPAWRAFSSAPASRGHRCDPRTARPARAPACGMPRPGSRPMRAVISAASSAGMMPSLSVLQAPPSNRLNEAPALSSPPKPRSPDRSPSTNHLKPDRHLVQPPLEPCGHPVDQRAARRWSCPRRPSGCHDGRCRNR